MVYVYRVSSSQVSFLKTYFLRLLSRRVARPDAGNPNSIPTFGYRNVLPLNKNVSLFQVGTL